MFLNFPSKVSIHVWDLDLHLILGLLGPQEFALKPAHDWFSRFAQLTRVRAQHEDHATMRHVQQEAASKHSLCPGTNARTTGKHNASGPIYWVSRGTIMRKSIRKNDIEIKRTHCVNG